MSYTIREIERKWENQFLECGLVDADKQLFNSNFAHQLYYGKIDDSYPPHFPLAFQEVYLKKEELQQHDFIEQTIPFLHFIGINLQAEVLQKHLEKFPDDFAKFTSHTYYIFKTLAHYGDSIDITKPFKDLEANLYFLSRIASQEAVTLQQLDFMQELELPDLYNRFSVFPDAYEENVLVQDLFKKINESSSCFFITGKAGTGKSTFIQYFTTQTHKKVLKLAFTGIAAINVGGQTIHSFFLFPLKPMMPNDDEVFRFKQNTKKYKLIQSIEVIVIDEVSMLRADILEAIDYSLRINGGNPALRFGGKQILFVGDIFQLPPVVNLQDEVEKIVFTEVYKSEYFFDSIAYRETQPVYFEFQKSYRQQSDLEFVKLLDEVRIGKVSEESLAALNKRYYPRYTPQRDEFVINLASTNYIANAENNKRLLELPYTSFFFEATIDGDFKSDKYPTSKMLELKKHAQVIFIKNDSKRRYVNGTIAKIDFISKDLLEIRLQDGSIHKLVKETWENRKYEYDPIKRRVVSKTVGTFTQYPIKLAWAITVHKSQGLSFDKVVLDMGNGAFVNGQMYTALSRCRSLNGLALKQKITQADLVMDERVVNFYLTENIIDKVVGED